MDLGIFVLQFSGNDSNKKPLLIDLKNSRLRELFWKL